MNLQERRDVIAKRLEDSMTLREKYRTAFMDLTSKIEQMTGAISILDQVMSEEDQVPMSVEENHGANSKAS